MPVEPYVRPGAIEVYFFYILCYHIENLRRLSGSRDAFCPAARILSVRRAAGRTEREDIL